MKTSAKQNILKRIKQALEKPVPLPFKTSTSAENYFIKSDDLEILFAENYTASQGRFSFCANEAELTQQLQTLIISRQWTKIYCNEEKFKATLLNLKISISTDINLADSDASVTSCESLVARMGSILLSSAQNGRTPSVYAPVHVCIAYTSQLVFDIKDALNSINVKYNKNLPSLITFASGPSRTADIEKTLVTGVHGPKEVFCFLVQS